MAIDVCNGSGLFIGATCTWLLLQRLSWKHRSQLMADNLHAIIVNRKNGPRELESNSGE